MHTLGQLNNKEMTSNLSQKKKRKKKRKARKVFHISIKHVEHSCKCCHHLIKLKQTQWSREFSSESMNETRNHRTRLGRSIISQWIDKLLWLNKEYDVAMVQRKMKKKRKKKKRRKRKETQKKKRKRRKEN